MGLLTQLIAQHHNDDVQKKATQVGLWKGILEDKRTPEDGGFTVDMKNHALEQMVGMANGGDGSGKGGKSGGKGKAGEMLGVFKHLLGLGNMDGSAGDGQGKLDQPMQNAAAQSGNIVPPQPQQNTDDPGAPGQGGQAPPQPLQRSPAIPISKRGLPPAFLSDTERAQKTTELSKQADDRAVTTQTALGAAKNKQALAFADQEAQMKADGVKKLVSSGVDQATAEAIYGVKAPPSVHKIGATDKIMKAGKPFIRTYYSDGTEKDEADVTPQATPKADGGSGLTGAAKNQLWARKTLSNPNASPEERQQAQFMQENDDNARTNKDLTNRVKSLQLRNLQSSTDPTSIAQLAEGVEKGLVDPNLTNMSRATATLVTAKLAKDGFNHAAAKQEYAAVKTAFASENSQQQLARRQNLSMAKESLPLIYDAGEAWSNAMKLSGKSPALNSVEMAAAKQGAYGTQAQQAAVVFEGQIADVQAELSSIYMGTAAPTDKAIELAQKSLKSNWSWDTLQAQLKQVHKNLDRRESALNNIAITGAGVGSTYIPKDDSGKPESTQTPPPATKDWKTTPDANGILTRPDGQQFKKVNGGFLPITKPKK